MTLQAVGEQYGISRERVRQIVKQMPRAAAEAMMARANLRNHPGAPVSWRLQAVMECLDRRYTKWGGQKKFAKDINIQSPNFNAIMRGSPLSKKVASAIFHRFQEEGVTLSFLYFGLAGRGMKPEFERKLLEWQDRNGKKIFSSDDEVFHKVSLPHEALATKAKAAVEVDPFARLQETVDAVRRMIEATKPSERSAQTIKALGVVATRARELIAELQPRNKTDPASKRDP